MKLRSHLARRAILATAITTSLSLSDSFATTWWDGISASWNSAANWSTVSGATSPNPGAVPTDDLVFNITTANGAATITLDNAQSAAGLTFNNTGSTVIEANSAVTTARALSLGTGGITLGASAGAVTLGSNASTKGAVSCTIGGIQSWTNNSTSLLTATGPVAVNNALTITGSGNTTFTGGGAWTGSGTVTKSGNGTMQVGNNSSIADRFTVDSLRGGNLTMNAGVLTVAPTRYFTIGDTSSTGTSTLSQTGGTINFTPTAGSPNSYDVYIGNATSAGQLLVSGGDFNVTASTSQIRVGQATAGTLTIGGGVGAASVNSATVSLAPGAGNGVMNLNSNGTLITGSLRDAAGAGTSSILFDSGTLKVRTGTAAGATLISTGFNTAQIKTGGLTIDTSGIDVTAAQALSNFPANVGKLTKIGSGILTLSGANAYTGGTDVNVGGVNFPNTTAKPATGTTNVAAAATLGLGVATSGSFFTSGDLDNYLSDAAPSGNLSNVTWTATSNLGIDTSAGDFTYNTSVASTSKGLIKLGANKLTLTGTNAYTGTTILKAGTLSVSSSANLGAPASNLVIDGGSLQITGTTMTSLGHTVSFTDGKAVSLDIVDAGNTLTIDQSLNQGSGSFTKFGAGTLILNEANNYTGATTVSGGILTLTGDFSGTAGAITVSNLAGIDAVLNIESGNYALGTNRFNVGSAATTPATGTVNQSGGSVTFSGAGDGLLLGNGNIANTANYNLSGGSITTGLSTTSRGIIIGTNTSSVAKFTLSGTGELNMTVGTGGTDTSILQIGRFDAAANNTTTEFSQTDGTANVAILSIGGNGTNGTGISSKLSLTGGIFVAKNFPRLAAGNTNTAEITIGGTADVTLPFFPTARGTSSTATLYFDGGTLRPFAASATYMGGLTNAYIKANGANFNVDSGKDITVTQSLLTDLTSLGGGLSKTGVGALTLSGTNTYTGTTTVSEGSLIPALVTALPGYNSLNKVVFDGGTIVTKIGDGTTNGWTTTQVDSLLANATKTGGALGIDTANGDLTQWTPFTTTNFGSALGLAKLGANALTLNVANTYTGGTLIRNGTIVMDHANALGTTGDITFDGPPTGTFSILKWGTGITTDLSSRIFVNALKAAVFDTNGNDVSFANSPVFLSNNGLIYKQGLGKLTLNAGFDFDRLDVNDGKLLVAAGDYNLSGYFTVNTLGSAADYEQTGGSVALTTFKGAYIGNVGSPVSTFTLSGGTFSVNGSEGFRVRAAGTSTINISSTGALSATGTNGIYFNKTAGGTAVFNLGDGTNFTGGSSILDGGTSGVVTTSKVWRDSTGTDNTFAFNGGTLRASAAATNFFDNNANIATKVSAAGGVIDNNAFAITLGEALEADTPSGGLVFKGAATTTLSGANTYTGNTTVSAGTTLALATGGSMKFAPASNGSSNKITGPGTATIGGTFNLDLTNAAIANGNSWTLVDTSSKSFTPGTFAITSTLPVSFVETGNEWTAVDGDNTWKFTESTGVLSLTVASGTPFSNWMSTNYPTVTANLPQDDPDGDGFNNLIEFALNGVPNDGSNNGYCVVATEDTNANTQKELTLTIAVRKASGSPVFSGSPLSGSADGVKYTIEGSLDLAFPNSAVSEATPASGPGGLPADYEYRRFRLNASEGLSGKGFLRVKIEPNP